MPSATIERVVEDGHRTEFACQVALSQVLADKTLLKPLDSTLPPVLLPGEHHGEDCIFIVRFTGQWLGFLPLVELHGESFVAKPDNSHLFSGWLFDAGIKQPKLEEGSLDGVRARYDQQLQMRKPYNARCILSVDPEHCGDVDDAFSAEEIEDKLKISVHIADVAAIVQSGDSADLNAQAAGTSTYLPAGEALHMFPLEIVELCSLKEGSPKLAVTFSFCVDGEGEVDHATFKIERTRVSVTRNLSYQRAEQLRTSGDTSEEANLLRLVCHRAEKMRLWRHRHGAVEFADINPQLLFTDDAETSTDDAVPSEADSETSEDEGETSEDEDDSSASSAPSGPRIRIAREIRTASHHMIEELMIAVNQLAAQRMMSLHPNDALLRVQDAPTKQLDLPTLDDNEDLVVLAKHRCAIKSGPSAQFCIVDTRVSKLSDCKHYSLNQLYTQATSPLRRYADLLVLRALLDDSSPAVPQAVVQHLNERERVIKRVQKNCRDALVIATLTAHPCAVNAVVVADTDTAFQFAIPDLNMWKVMIKKYALAGIRFSLWEQTTVCVIGRPLRARHVQSSFDVLVKDRCTAHLTDPTCFLPRSGKLKCDISSMSAYCNSQASLAEAAAQYQAVTGKAVLLQVQLKSISADCAFVCSSRMSELLRHEYPYAVCVRSSEPLWCEHGLLEKGFITFAHEVKMPNCKEFTLECYTISTPLLKASRMLRLPRLDVPRVVNAFLDSSAVEFFESTPAAVLDLSAAGSLNAIQQQSVILSCGRNLVTVQGPPGTGKTTTAVQTALAHVRLGHKVLVVTPSNKAANHFCRQCKIEREKAQPKLELVRKFARSCKSDYPYDLADVDLKSLVDARLLEQSESGSNRSEDSIEWDILNEAQILVMTLHCALAMGSSCYADVVLVDEAAQAPEADVLALTIWWEPKVLLLYGDDAQIGPFNTARTPALRTELTRSMFDRLRASKVAVTMLTVQYRMHPEIRMFPSKRYYDNRLEDCVTPTPIRGFPFPRGVNVPVMLLDVAGECITGRVLVDAGVDCSDDTNPFSLCNMAEVDAVVDVVALLHQRCGVPFRSMAIITPYSAQNDAIKKRVSEVKECGTVHSLQGSEASVVILSMVQSNGLGSPNFIDPKVLNVSITRAKDALIVIANRQHFQSQSSQVGALVADLVERECVLPYEDLGALVADLVERRRVLPYENLGSGMRIISGRVGQGARKRAAKEAQKSSQ
eukprot:TRINITY_DN5980_c0_g2_i2.p2 TRINITY_DN5980_c0_g2~~TRINITY_DN5980_c0_g2_i2.p2  ORF type:complete len:1218 (+),score=195.10 TRINITY_DN5980_c0_g2_i2:4118-7771(+)